MFIETILANAFGGAMAVSIVALYKRFVAESHEMLNRRQAITIFVITFVIIFLTDLTPMPIGETIRVWFFGPPSQNERWTIEAWRALEKRDYNLAIASAEQVIDQYAGIAERQQMEFDNQGFRLVVISSGFARNLAGQNEISRSARNDKRKS